MTFTEKLNYLMEQKGIKNRSQLSKLSGIPYTTIVGFFEKGTENIRRTTLIKLSDFFDCSLEYLVSDEIHDENYGKSVGFNINSSEILHIQKYRALDEHGKKVIDVILEIESERCQTVLRDSSELIEVKVAARSKDGKIKPHTEYITKAENDAEDALLEDMDEDI